MKPQRVCCKLGETIEQPFSDALAHTWKCERVLVYTTSIQLSRMVTVMSSMDPHMIR
jgi:hypothetical protein